MKKFYIALIFLFILTINGTSIKPHDKKLILDDWKLKIDSCPSPHKMQGLQLQTSLPTNLHLDLLHYKKIQDPLFGKNWQSQKWISECNIIYIKKLDITNQMLKYDSIILVFEGIDTYSTVKLNQQILFTTHNSFVEYKVNIKNLVKQGINLLEVAISSTKSYDEVGQKSNPMPFPYAQTRKACYQYSWDWAPYMNTLGIWKDVYVEFYDEIAIDYVWIQIQQLNEQYANLNFAIKINSNNQATKFQSYDIAIELNGSIIKQQKLQFAQTYVLLKIQKPKLWWPNGIGQSYIYDFKVKLISGQKQMDFKLIPYGIRSVHLDQSENKFTVVINGYRVYCKGANYVPPDMLYPRLTNKNYKAAYSFKQIIDDAVRSNFNMIRVWGGGQYESNQFYQMASRKGIMIFHDFMFSDSIYPSTKEFLDNVQKEIVQQVRRIRNYPCLTLWSGNNQILQGILSWGWSSPKFKQDYKKLFEQHIPQIILHQSPYIPYVPSSPVKGVGNSGFQKGGDVHYWGVWAAGAAFQEYRNAVGPFNSQFGTQSLPVWQTIKAFTNQGQRSYNNPQIISHERHNSQFKTLRRYMQKYAKTSLNFQLQVYQSGLVQQYGIQIAIRYQRLSKKDKSMGTLYWQFNDAWPAISWSAIDYYGRWKPLQYKAKKLYTNVIAIYDAFNQKVYAINDNLYSVNCILENKAMSFDGKIHHQKNETFTLRQNEIKEIPFLKDQLKQLDSTLNFVVNKIHFGNKEDQSITLPTFLTTLKEIKLPRCELKVKYRSQQNSIILQASCLLKSLHIYHSSEYLSLSDNYIDIIPGQIYKIKLLNMELKPIIKDIKYRSYRQVHENDPLDVKAEEQ